MPEDIKMFCKYLRHTVFVFSSAGNATRGVAEIFTYFVSIYDLKHMH